MSQIQFSLKYLDLVPRPTKEDFNVLKESLISKGQQEPIIINQDGVILDGHTRYEILSSRGIDIKYLIREFHDQEAEQNYVIECNLARRHLNAFQKIELTYSIYLIMKGRYKRGGNTRTQKNTGGGASAVIGKTIGVDRNTVARGAWLIEHANDELLERLRHGGIGVTEAYNLLLNKRRQTKTPKFYYKKFQCPHCKHELRKEDLVYL